MRRCVRYYYRKQRIHEFNGCEPVFIDKFVHELDFYQNLNQTQCYFLNIIHNNANYNSITSKCLKYCPKDCVTVDYKYKVVSSDTQIGNDLWYNSSEENRITEKSLVWD